VKRLPWLFALFILVIFAAPAAAETDGFKVYLGYVFSGAEMKTNWDEDWADKVNQSAGTNKQTGVSHGVGVDLRYQGSGNLPLWGRVTFEYGWITGGNDAYDCYDNFNLYRWAGKPGVRGDAWQVEGDLGYRVFALPFSGGTFDITPYAGFGYRERKIEYRNGSGEEHKLQAPFAAFGALFSYNSPAWGVGLDAAFIMPISSDFTYVLPDARYPYRSDIGYGVRVQLPVMVSVVRQKAGRAGVSLFATPFYEYTDYGRSDPLRMHDGAYGAYAAYAGTKEGRYGVRAGIGLSF
jgi:hypothetical protein